MQSFTRYRATTCLALALACSACGGSGGVPKPGGDVVAFVADALTPGVFEVFVSDATGLGHRKVAGPVVAGGDAFAIEWSPDRSLLAVLGDLETDGKFELFLVDPDAAAPVLSKVSGSGADAGVGGVQSFAWAPNGARIAFTKAQDALGRFDLFTVFSTGVAAIVKVSAPVTAVGSSVGVSTFFWKPGGNTLAYAADLEVDNTFHLFVVGANGAGHQQVNVPVGNPVDDDVQGYAWAPDGSRLAFGYKENGAGFGTVLFSCLPTGLGLVKLSLFPATNRTLMSFAWAPDSSRLLYTADTNVQFRNDLFVVAADGVGGSQPLVLAGATEDVFSARWAPGSDRIAYLLGDGPANTNDLFVLPATGGMPLLLAAGGPGSGDFIEDPRWSPDGTDLCYSYLIQSTGLYQSELHVVRGDGTAHRLLDPSGEDSYPSVAGWSPDGKRIAYAFTIFTDSTGPNARVVDRASDGPRQLSDVPVVTNQPTAAGYLAWTPDSACLLFLAAAPGSGGLQPYPPHRLWIAGAGDYVATDLIGWAPPEAGVVAYRLK